MPLSVLYAPATSAAIPAKVIHPERFLTVSAME
jgi:hypothetical protein